MQLKEFLDSENAWGKKITDHALSVDDDYYIFYWSGASSCHGRDKDVTPALVSRDYSSDWHLYVEPKKTVRKFLWVYKGVGDTYTLQEEFLSETEVLTFDDCEKYIKLQPEVYVDIEVGDIEVGE